MTRLAIILAVLMLAVTAQAASAATLTVNGLTATASGFPSSTTQVEFAVIHTGGTTYFKQLASGGSSSLTVDPANYPGQSSVQIDAHLYRPLPVGPWLGRKTMTFPPPTPATPTLSVAADGRTLTWTASQGATSYKVATSDAATAPRTTTYTTVTGTSYDPPDVSGATRWYGIQALNASGASGWSNEVSIAYPTTPPPPSSTGPFRGVNTNWQGWGLTATVAAEIRAFGAQYIREDFGWSGQTPGAYNWTALDNLMSRAAAENLKVLPVIGGDAHDATSMANATGYAAFVQAAVQRYPQIVWWELWNEPYWTGQPGAYARAVKAAVQAGRQANPNARFLVVGEYNDWPCQGCAGGFVTGWIDGMYTAVPDLNTYIDGVVHHPYGGDPTAPYPGANAWKDGNGNDAVARIDKVRSVFAAHGQPTTVPYWATEMGWTTGNGPGAVTATTAATYYQHFATFLAARPWIRAVLPFCLREFSGDGTNEPEFGLLNFGDWAAKPDYQPAKTMLAGLQ